jgi:hypothetical protein
MDDINMNITEVGYEEMDYIRLVIKGQQCEIMKTITNLRVP